MNGTMVTLDKSLRNRLENSIRTAREVAEKAARAAIEQLGVGDATAPKHLSETERELRRSLRAHGRQLGDNLSSKDVQEIDLLVEEIAYEHWHRMLFARFLAENNLLIYPDPESPVAVTLEECEDLAAEAGANNGWELAASFAARMLPQIFRPDSPAFKLVLPPEHQHKLENLLADLPRAVFTATDSLGWVYQFWQARKKNQVNDAEIKIGARELSAVTQLFTEPYMVSHLLDNTLGAWWAARRLTERDKAEARSEDELRQKSAVDGVPLEFIRFIRNENGLWQPAAGNFEKWPEQPCQLKIIDPCCGSGHFLVAAFMMFVPMRMHIEGLSAREAIDRVLAENIHALELDQRCVELAAFALALAAWKFPEGGGYRPLPELHIACSGMSVSAARDEWKKAGLGRKDLSLALEWLHDSFKDAPVLGSLLNPAHTPATKIVNWQDLSKAMTKALLNSDTEDQREAGVVASGLAKAATLLASHYHLVITNVPYLARGKQNDTLREFCEKYYPEAKSDLATVFLERCLEMCKTGGTASVVLPQNWLQLTSYRTFRKKLLDNDTWHLVARLGEGGFDSPAAAGAFVAMIILSRSDDNNVPGLTSNIMRGLDVSEATTSTEKARLIIETEIQSIAQAEQLTNPDFRIGFAKIDVSKLLNLSAKPNVGFQNGDTPRFIRFFWDSYVHHDAWRFIQMPPGDTRFYTGNTSCVSADLANGNIEAGGWHDQSSDAYGSGGVLVRNMRNLSATLFDGGCFDQSGTAITCGEALLPALWAFASSDEFQKVVRSVEKKVNVTPATFGKILFESQHWEKVAAEQYPNGLPRPFSDDPTQWLFHGHPCGSVIWDEAQKRTVHGPMRTDATVLQVAVARLLGYRWPAEFNENLALADEQREWVKRCDTLTEFADQDGIVCISPTMGEPAATDRLLNLLAAAYGKAWSNDTLARLLTEADHSGRTLETWLRDKFFTQHCEIFQDRPFIWHIWDGLRDGFSALVNYHKLDYKTLETLIYTYLGDWAARQKKDMANGIDGAAEKLAAAEALKKRLELILEGEAPYDIFVRWKPLEKQPIGWNPDLNDGVRLNIRPFMSVPDIAKKGAGILRDKPNIKWDKDRGKDVASAPWYHLFNGDRINDHHLPLRERCSSRQASSQN